MKKINIITAQNVNIEYQLATAGDRILSFVIDFGILMIFYGVLAFFAALTGNGFFTNLVNYLMVILFLIYDAVAETLLDGQTLGKRLIKIRVVKLNGEKPTIGDYLLRGLFRIVDIFLSSGGVAIVLISTSTRGQRIGDILAGTTIIRLKSHTMIDLGRILSIKKEEDYEATYPEVTRLVEEDMLLIKKILRQRAKYTEKTYRDLILELCGQLAEVLHIEAVPKNKTQFLKTLLKDYISLTR